MGISPELWGKEAWHFIHYVALSYPENPTPEDKDKYLSFLKSLEFVLPCSVCAANFKHKMEINPPKLESRKDFFNWTVDIHNSVNEVNGKKILSYHEALTELRKKWVQGQFSDTAKAVILSFSMAAVLIGTISEIYKPKK